MSDQLSSQQLGTRERIVESARQLFFEQGYTATGIAQILERSAANSGSLYHFFPTKEDLLAAVLEKYQEMLHPVVIGPGIERASDPLEQVFAVLDGYRRLLEATQFHLGCPIGNLALEISNSHPKVRTLVVANFEGWVGAIHLILDQAAGRLPASVDRRSLAYHILATMEGAVMLARSYQSLEPFDHAISGLRDHIERLVTDGAEWSAPRPL